MSNLSKTTATPYCKVCHDAGKDESIYLSHFIRENKTPGSKVVCPTLLAQECRYCFKPGHTVKYCKEIKRVQIKKNQQSKKEREITTNIAIENKNNNIYSALSFDDDNDSDEEQQEQSTMAPLSYKSIIEITKKQVLQEEIEKIQEAEKRKEEEIQRKNQETEKKAFVPTPIPAPIYIRKACAINWADDSTSDEDY